MYREGERPGRLCSTNADIFLMKPFKDLVDMEQRRKWGQEVTPCVHSRTEPRPLGQRRISSSDGEVNSCSLSCNIWPQEELGSVLWWAPIRELGRAAGGRQGHQPGGDHRARWPAVGAAAEGASNSCPASRDGDEIFLNSKCKTSCMSGADTAHLRHSRQP